MLKPFYSSLRTEANKYALAGALFGLLFPVIATAIRITNSDLPLEFSSVVAVQRMDSLLWIIDTAPVFLGLFAYFAGQRQDYLLELNRELQQRESELESAQRHLELNIEERTRELVTANQETARRAEQLRLIADVARSAISIQDVDRQLPYIARLISERFNFYHVGIFLLDEQKQYAILRASNSPSGLMMIERSHRLKVGAQGLVGYVAQTGQARIALNVNEDEADLGSAHLPDTRSQIALPLKSGDVILGVLDLQSTQPDAFSADDAPTLTILADQMAIAIQNVMSYEDLQRALYEAEFVSRQASGQAWKGYAQGLERRGYRYDGVRSEPLKETGSASERSNVLDIPVRLRGQTIGHLKINHADPAHTWTEDDLAMAQATSERVALALEDARLLADAHKRAAREKFLADISAKLGTSFQMDSILRDTVQELGQTFKHSAVTFQLVNPSDPLGAHRYKDNGDSGNEEESE